MAALSKCVNGLLNAENTEYVALTYSLRWAQDGFAPLEAVESDALGVVQTYHNLHKSRSPFSGLMLDISILLSSFPGVLLNYVNRDTSKAANCLARCALTIDNELVWIEEVPKFVISVVLQDLS
ncbi:hypothetical protein PanWU01x14_228020 [Parasponia andersonii]|uniref:RNase H type-1 domain-containing protein n=1 Tax=Parasponia andersonii TaxID=3476 RepID=A0A2P5BLU9_PARAD|nr:hypothetical protein PanWU01x14_228020 [Parasponia andersonii]